MNELITKLYDKAIVIEDGGDYVFEELDPVKFAELIVKECANIALMSNGNNLHVYKLIKEHFGVEE